MGAGGGGRDESSSDGVVSIADGGGERSSPISGSVYTPPLPGRSAGGVLFVGSEARGSVGATDSGVIMISSEGVASSGGCEPLTREVIPRLENISSASRRLWYCSSDMPGGRGGVKAGLSASEGGGGALGDAAGGCGAVEGLCDIGTAGVGGGGTLGGEGGELGFAGGGGGTAGGAGGVLGLAAGGGTLGAAAGGGTLGAAAGGGTLGGAAAGGGSLGLAAGASLAGALCCSSSESCTAGIALLGTLSMI